MRLAGRVRVLERRSGLRGPCPRCDGRGWPGAEMVRDSDYSKGMPLPKGCGCPGCGRVSDFKWIIMQGEVPEWAR